jgi:hypothetical protein
MNKEDGQGKFTVFGDAPLFAACNVNVNSHLTLDGLIADWAHCGLTAWAPELIEKFGGTKSVDTLRAESIAAGRTIELVDGKYIPRGLEDKPTTEPTAGFRIGAYYLTNNGGVAHITSARGEYLYGCTDNQPADGQVWRANGHYWTGVGLIEDMRLIPGECDEHGNPIPTFYVSPETMKPTGDATEKAQKPELDEEDLLARAIACINSAAAKRTAIAKRVTTNAAMIARDGPAKPAQPVAAVQAPAKPSRTVHAPLAALTALAPVSAQTHPSHALAAVRGLVKG